MSKSPRKYFSGRSLEQALMEAASYYGIDPSEVDYQEVEKRHGFVRVRRNVVITVDPDSPRKSADGKTQEREPGLVREVVSRGDGPGRDEAEEDDGVVADAEQDDEDDEEAGVDDDRDDERDGGRRGRRRGGRERRSRGRDSGRDSARDSARDSGRDSGRDQDQGGHSRSAGSERGDVDEEDLPPAPSWWDEDEDGADGGREARGGDRGGDRRRGRGRDDRDRDRGKAAKGGDAEPVRRRVRAGDDGGGPKEDRQPTDRRGRSRKGRPQEADEDRGRRRAKGRDDSSRDDSSRDDGRSGRGRGRDRSGKGDEDRRGGRKEDGRKDDGRTGDGRRGDGRRGDDRRGDGRREESRTESRKDSRKDSRRDSRRDSREDTRKEDTRADDVHEDDDLELGPGMDWEPAPPEEHWTAPMGGQDYDQGFGRGGARGGGRGPGRGQGRGPGRGHGRGGGRGGGRSAGPGGGHPGGRGGGPKGGKRDQRGGRGKGGDDQSAHLPPVRRERRQENLPLAEGPMAEACLEGLEQLLEFVDVVSEAEVYQGDGRLEVELWGPDDALLLEDDGDLLLAIEHMLPRLIRGFHGDTTAVRVDCADFHARREERLQELAAETADEVRRRGKPKTLDEMDPAERRLVHMAVADDPDVETESVGSGYFKRVKIVPR